MCNPDSCIASTAIGIKVLKRFGVEAWPVPVDLHIYNNTFIDMINHFDELGREPTKQEQKEWLMKGAWTIQIDRNDRDPDNHVGHLVIGIDGHLLDLSLDQASRPHKQIHLEPMAIPATARNFYAHEGDRFTYEVLPGCVVKYMYHPENQVPFTSPDWTRADERYHHVVERIEDRIRTRLTTKG